MFIKIPNNFIFFRLDLLDCVYINVVTLQIDFCENHILSYSTVSKEGTTYVVGTGDMILHICVIVWGR